MAPEVGTHIAALLSPALFSICLVCPPHFFHQEEASCSGFTHTHTLSHMHTPSPIFKRIHTLSHLNTSPLRKHRCCSAPTPAPPRTCGRWAASCPYSCWAARPFWRRVAARYVRLACIVHALCSCRQGRKPSHFPERTRSIDTSTNPTPFFLLLLLLPKARPNAYIHTNTSIIQPKSTADGAHLPRVRFLRHRLAGGDPAAAPLRALQAAEARQVRIDCLFVCVFICVLLSVSLPLFSFPPLFHIHTHTSHISLRPPLLATPAARTPKHVRERWHPPTHIHHHTFMPHAHHPYT